MHLFHNSSDPVMNSRVSGQCSHAIDIYIRKITGEFWSFKTKLWYDCPMVFTHANLSLSDVNLTGFLEYEVISI